MILLDLPSLSTIIIGQGSFSEVSTTTIESIFSTIQYIYIDLASLSLIQLGERAFYGKNETSCSLKMQSYIIYII